jgi:hypothetical protein
MLRGFDLAIEGVVRRVAYDARSLCDRIDSIADEDDFTSRLAEKIEISLNGKLIDGVRFTALTKKLKWRGSHSEEKAAGADLILVLNLKDNEVELSKGYLVQSKMNSAPPTEIVVSDRARLSHQIDGMLRITSDAYIWAYSDGGVAVARAGSFKPALDSGRAREFDVDSFSGFFAKPLTLELGITKLELGTTGNSRS